MLARFCEVPCRNEDCAGYRHIYHLPSPPIPVIICQLSVVVAKMHSRFSCSVPLFYNLANQYPNTTLSPPVSLHIVIAHVVSSLRAPVSFSAKPRKALDDGETPGGGGGGGKGGAKAKYRGGKLKE